MARYIVYNDRLEVVNVIEYDGAAPYHPGPGLALAPHDTAEIGHVLVAPQTWLSPDGPAAKEIARRAKLTAKTSKKKTKAKAKNRRR